jgi:transcription termination factor NusB
MWDKNFRIAVFSLLYEILFTGMIESDFNTKSNSEKFKKEVLALNDVFKGLDLETVLDQIRVYFEKQYLFEEKIKASIKTWDKTFLTVKACLYTFCLEIEGDNVISNLDSKIVNSYLKLAQDYLGQENVSLVHANVLKILNYSKV